MTTNREELRFRSFGSGSSGNSFLLTFNNGTDKSGLIVDTGVSLRRVKQYLTMCGETVDSFDGILITHEHYDHIRFLGSFCKALSKPVFAPKIIHNFLAHHYMTEKYISSCRRVLDFDKWEDLGAFRFKAFAVPHDARQTVGYVIDSPNHRLVHMTDLGELTPEALSYAKTANTVIIESNYDEQMLLTGDYPPELKNRILQGAGHLSNEACANAIKEFYHKDIKNLFLCHLSANTNTPELALTSAKNALLSIGVDMADINLQVLPRTEPSNYLTLHVG